MALMLAASVSVIVPHAEAATRPGPVTALKQQLNGHGGVRQSSVYRSVWGPKRRRITAAAAADFGPSTSSVPVKSWPSTPPPRSPRPAAVPLGPSPSRTTLYEGSVTIGELYKLDPRLWVSKFEKPTGK
jgi:hypothetical protein